MKRHKNGILGTLFFHLVLLNVFFILKISSNRDLESSNILIEFENNDINFEKKVNEAINKEILLGEDINYTNYAYKLSKLKQIEEKYFNNEENNDQEEVTQEYINEIIKKAIGEELFKEFNNKEIEFNDDLKKDEINKTDTFKYKDKHIIYKGPSTLIYEIENRTAIKLPLPVYKCEGGGVVKLAIEVNRNGNVVKAVINEYNENKDDNCILQAALSSAFASKFNHDDNAPEIQEGMIIYTFISQ
ncbi:MAG: hypothetical protein JXB17_02045 [Bacteroidales bacterium]|nr:hypothetical protein [Bacteroidales bacterium]